MIRRALAALFDALANVCRPKAPAPHGERVPREQAPACVSSLIESLETRFYDKEVTGEFRLSSLERLPSAGRAPARRYRIVGRTELHTSEGFRGSEETDLVATVLGDVLLETAESNGSDTIISTYHNVDAAAVGITAALAQQFGSRTTTRGDDLTRLTLGEVLSCRIVHSRRLGDRGTSSQVHFEAEVRFAEPVERPEGRGWHDPSTPPPTRTCHGALVTVGADDEGKPSSVQTIHYLSD